MHSYAKEKLDSGVQGVCQCLLSEFHFGPSICQTSTNRTLYEAQCKCYPFQRAARFHDVYVNIVVFRIVTPSSSANEYRRFE